MAILHRKEEKIQVVLGRLPKKYTHEEFVQMFIKLYSKDWGKIKSAYIKQNQDREPGTVVNMPKPDLYLQQLLDTYLATAPSVNKLSTTATEQEPLLKAKQAAKKKTIVETDEMPATKTKAAPKKTKEEEPAPAEEVKKKAPVKKKVTAEKPAAAKKSKSTDK